MPLGIREENCAPFDVDLKETLLKVSIHTPLVMPKFLFLFFSRPAPLIFLIHFFVFFIKFTPVVFITEGLNFGVKFSTAMYNTSVPRALLLLSLILSRNFTLDGIEARASNVLEIDKVCENSIMQLTISGISRGECVKRHSFCLPFKSASRQRLTLKVLFNFIRQSVSLERQYPSPDFVIHHVQGTFRNLRPLFTRN